MRVYRSPLRMFVFGLVGLMLMIAAVDIMFGHWVSTEPENNEGVLTTRGQAQQRGDIIWGGAMIGVGTLLFGGSIIELVRRKPIVTIDGEGILAAIGATERDVRLGWDHIERVSSGVYVDPYDGSQREQLLVGVTPGAPVPGDLISAARDGDVIRIDAHDWTQPVTEVALAAQGALDYHRRVTEIGQMGEPSLVWETRVVVGDEAPRPDDSGGEVEPASEDPA